MRKTARPKPRAAPSGKPRWDGAGPKPLQLKEIAQWVGGRVIGDDRTLIRGLCGIREAKAGDLTFVANARYLHLLKTTRASAVIASKEVAQAPIPILQTEDPSLAFAKLAALMGLESQRHPRGVSPKAVLGKGVRLGKGVALQAYVVVEEGAEIGDRTILYSGCYVGHQARIGNDCLIYPNVTIRERVQIGHRVILHAGSVIGSDGFGFVTTQGVHHKIPQLGTVVVEDDVEVGANVTIDRARFGKTVVGKGTKIDNLVQIAHNVVTGTNCILVAQSGISGSTTLGNNVVLAGQVGIVGHITIGDNVMVGAQAGVSKSVPPDTRVWGYPAKEHSQAKRIHAAVSRLPEMVKAFQQMRRRLETMERRLSEERPPASQSH